MENENRMRCRRDFLRVYQHGSVRFGRYLVMHLLPVSDSPTKVGISVSRKVGNAVIRNRIKRRLREIMRLNWQSIPEQHYLVVSAKVKSRDASYRELETDFNRLLKG